MTTNQKKKYKRTVVGQILKGKEGKPDYFKASTDFSLAKGSILNLESKASQIKKLDENVSLGKLSEELAGQIKERLEKIPDFVRFEVVLVENT